MGRGGPERKLLAHELCTYDVVVIGGGGGMDGPSRMYLAVDRRMERLRHSWWPLIPAAQDALG